MNATTEVVSTRSSRMLRAGVYGYFAALAGGLVLFCAGLSGYNVSVLAIAVGWAVGTAVATGSDRRGGWFYRTLAVGLTYLAVGASLSPTLHTELQTPRPGIDLYERGDMKVFKQVFAGKGAPIDPPPPPLSRADRWMNAVISAVLLPWMAIPMDGLTHPWSGLSYVTALFVAGFRSRRVVPESARSPR
ncbi:hypothetical protein D7X30_24555 [Corallococcus sp. AB011P]|uniref:hypothetical protein n=1 Tax=unclassified Corallococcus TaxID=2685029 RepID=UPI000EA3DDAF|nr:MULTISPECIES: hypothetical protein [unclassified Corallococcus]RKG56179.1 hypothetical protein D7X30_24555 [Corallococcus sp. AB011P]RKH85868.1 hypothetical protein D7Y21_22100 [Corallococcus sp. AB045]